ncbi:glycosyltransferase family 2 protein [Hoylesella timonensis]|uniref:Glycosyltransferase, group 2 family protein n=1 Tax=Hoylesella timonensis CRIS 5C-B1 TaxID=679189 RepID=D1W1V3_9BACT|nr:glycosyltransferase family A protein [Hoylesella timonensis]EFA96637.1 glycosyltransferase, group 2 family protein [Hoylesella timonensis CRIS 5C-B1]
MIITVFTPTYNRAHLLPRLFESLVKQTYRDFEWIIVDDGSSDNTAEVINEWDADFPIRYYRKENGGKHTAINVGVKKANGELFLILDSDDSLPKDSLEIIAKQNDACSSKKDCAGVCGLMAHHNGERIGGGFPAEVLYESSLYLGYKLGVTGDLLEVFKASVLREFPFPEINGEKFCPEVLVWNRIAVKYKLYCFNKVVYYRDYLEGGLTDNIIKIRMKSPVATCMTYSEMLAYSIPIIQKIKAAINYWRFRCCVQTYTPQVPRVKYFWRIFRPIGYLVHIKDRKVI